MAKRRPKTHAVAQSENTKLRSGGQRKKVTISDIARVLLADGTPTAKIALLTGLSENEIKRLIELNKANIF